MTPSIKQCRRSDFFDALRNLEHRLLGMIDGAEVLNNVVPTADPFRGLYVSHADVVRYLTIAGGPPGARNLEVPLSVGDAFTPLQDIFGLSSQALDVLLIAMAPEVDPRYERIFAFLQDDVRRRRPTIDLILNVLSGSATDKLDNRTLFEPTAPLLTHRLIRLLGEDPLPMAQREVSVDPRIADFLLGGRGLDARLARSVRIFERRSGVQKADPRLVKLTRRANANRLALPVYFQGADEDEKRDAAVALADEFAVRLLVAHIGRAVQGGVALSDWMADLAREALLWPSIVYLEGLDTAGDEPSRDLILGALGCFRGLVILSGLKPLRTARAPVKGLITVTFAVPVWRERRHAWSAALREQGLRARGPTLDTLAEMFHFGHSQIKDSAQVAANLVAYAGRNADSGHIFEAARSRSSQALAALTVKITPSHGWDDIVLPAETTEQLRELCRRVSLRHRVMGDWGFSRKLSGGKGVNALFHGHSGTGKTMSAEVIARELRLDLYKIDLAGVVSKYIGETEQNLDRIFEAAADASAILLFDEADALFGKRSEVRDAHDRYANLEVSYLLQKMEQHEGVSILATNLRQNLDDAFLRRLAFTVQFPFPDEEGRRRIWTGIWPRETPIAADVDPQWLAARYMLSGGNIRNAALAAAYLAAKDGDIVRMLHVLHAVRSEFQKLGKTLDAAELAAPLAVATGRSG